jgi:hypothetical protein
MNAIHTEPDVFYITEVNLSVKDGGGTNYLPCVLKLL